MKLHERTNLNGVTQGKASDMYADFILDGPIDETERINKMIVFKWNSAALTLIKNKAWRIIKKVEKGKHLSKSL